MLYNASRKNDDDEGGEKDPARRHQRVLLQNDC